MELETASVRNQTSVEAVPGNMVIVGGWFRPCLFLNNSGVFDNNELL